MDMKTGVPTIERIDFYDHGKLEKLQERRARKWIRLFLKAKRGDLKAREEIKKHEAEDRVLRARASYAGYCWT